MQNQARNLVIVALVAALVVVTCWKQTWGQGEPAKLAMPQWEYQVVDAASGDWKPLGGWEVCAAYSEGQLAGGAGNIKGKIVLKRPKPAK